MFSECLGYQNEGPATYCDSLDPHNVERSWSETMKGRSHRQSSISPYGRYGYRRITVLLRRQGWQVNHKRVERIWRREGLRVPHKQPKRSRLWLNDGSCVRLRALQRNHVWSYDFVMDQTHCGKAYWLLTGSSTTITIIITSH